MSSIITSGLKSFTLATLVLASAAHACDILPTNNGGWAICAATNDSGYTYLYVNGSWRHQLYYHVIDARWKHIYHYGPRLWTLEDGTSVWVAFDGVWTPYRDYQAAIQLQQLSLLASLAALSQSQTPPSTTPMIPMVVSTAVYDTCTDFRTMQALYTDQGFPMMHNYPLCGF